MTRKVLVAGIGNVFFGDDAFGVEVVRRMRGDELPQGASVADFGIRGLHLAFELMNSLDALVLVDAAQRGKEPGTLYLIDPQRDTHSAPLARPDPHGMDVQRVFEAVHGMGGKLPWTRVVGCEPADTSERMELSAPVLQAVPAAIEMIHQLIRFEAQHHEQPQ